MKTYRFTLYVAGRSPRSERAIGVLRKLCDEDLAGDCEWSVVDVLEEPDRAETRRVLSTPTLDKEAPEPFRRVVGDLTQAERLLSHLGIYL